MKAIRIVLLLALACSSLEAACETVVVRRGKPRARITVANDDTAADTAAKLLQRFVRESSGATLPISYGATARRGDISIGACDTTGLTEDGFRLRTTEDGVLCISSGGGLGAVYGAVTLLERFLGMEYYAADVYTIERRTDIVLPRLDTAENPAFRYRQSQAYGMECDSVYRMFLRLKEPQDIFAGGLWVHTFDRLLPASVYGSEHPEYYAFTNGERRPGSASQWCLSNSEVLEIAAARIDSIFKADPQKNIISVSQNDSDFTFCRCDECERVNVEEGSPAGRYIRFANRLAERFPDKQISTLAYLFTMRPPRHTRPLPNVNIMLCDIDCHREAPLTETESGRRFVEALEGWSALSDNIFVWDYGINFDNMIAPFPNFPILRPNIELFKRHNAKMHFSQIGGSYGGDFSEMRSWVVSKLMWNPNQDTDSLMLRFMNGYYGAAAPYIYRYEKLLEGALLASGQHLWIYDSPVSHKDGMLNEACRRRYGELFDLAERAVAQDSVLLRRVHLARLPLIYSNLEIYRTDPESERDEVERELTTFERYITQTGVTTLNERNNSPTEYCRLYRSRYMTGGDAGIARGAHIEWGIPPAEKYRDAGAATLADGLFGGSTFADGWTGWEGTDGSLTLDLGSEKEFTSVSTDFLHQLGAWILLPREVTYSVSDDNISWRELGRATFAEDRTPAVKFAAATVCSQEPVRARYVRIEIEGVKTCPPWHYGVGCPCWFFADEIVIR